MLVQELRNLVSQTSQKLIGNKDSTNAIRIIDTWNAATDSIATSLQLYDLVQCLDPNGLLAKTIFINLIGHESFTYLVSSLTEHPTTDQMIQYFYRIAINNVDSVLTEQQISFIRFLQQHDSLNKGILEFINQHSLQSTNLDSIARVLKTNNLLNSENLSLFYQKNYDLNFIQELVSYFDAQALLTIANLKLVIEYIDTKPSSYILILFYRLSLKKIALSQDVFLQILTLSEKNADRLSSFIYMLLPEHITNGALLPSAIAKLTIKLPQPSPVTAIKYSRKQTKNYCSKWLINNSITLFAEHDPHKRYPEGAWGSVKKGFLTTTATQPYYAIKKLTEPDLETAAKAAQHETRFHQLLGREAVFFVHNKKFRIIMKWMNEKTLQKFSRKELLQTDIKLRIECLISLLKELDILHKNYCMHGDIKPENIMLSIKTKTLRLIDFGSSHKPYIKEMYPFTEYWKDKKVIYPDSLCDDIYSLGLTIESLFPELESVKAQLYHFCRVIKISSNHAETTLMKAISLLITTMQQTRDSRCTSAEALSFCEQILQAVNSQGLTEAKIAEIKANTIAKTDIPVESIVRGRMSTA